MYVFRTLIVPTALAPMVRGLCSALAGEAGKGMFDTPLAPIGETEPSHYISSGPIEDGFAALLESPAVMHATCEAAGLPVSLEDCTAILSQCYVTEAPAFDFLATLGLELAHG